MHLRTVLPCTNVSFVPLGVKVQGLKNKVKKLLKTNKIAGKARGPIGRRINERFSWIRIALDSFIAYCLFQHVLVGPVNSAAITSSRSMDLSCCSLFACLPHLLRNASYSTVYLMCIQCIHTSAETTDIVCLFSRFV